jgi:glycosyltransferase involved in cell wall biosynthesis
MTRGRLTPAVDTITAGISDADRSRFLLTMEKTGLYPHDILCVSEYTFTDDFLAETHTALNWAEVVVIVTPYLSCLIFPQCRSGHFKIYDAHNVERHAKAQYYAASRDPVVADQLITDTIFCEAYALDVADVVLAVSRDDAASFAADYGVNTDKIRLVPNGVDVAAYDAIPLAAKRELREKLQVRDLGIYISSAYGPNVDSYQVTRQWLDQAGFSGAILILGRIVEVDHSAWPSVGFTEHWLGFVDERVKCLLVGATDFTLQIVTSGGGTNLKLFDYMASRVPILANAFGSRGITDDAWFLPVNSAEEMAAIVAARAWRSEQAANAARNAHQIAVRDFDWNAIAVRYERLLP